MSLDNWWMWNDAFSAFNGGKKGTKSWTAHYDVPVSWWLIGATASAYDYRQAVAGPYQTYVYSGTSQNAELRAARLLFRNATIKTGVYGRGWWKDSTRQRGGRGGLF